MKIIRRIEILIIAVSLIIACSMVLTCNDSYATSGPGKVYNLKVSRYTPDQVKLSWDKATGASSYKVYRKVSNGTYKFMRTVDGRAAVFKQTQGKRYYYKVRAYRKGKYGKYSSAKSFLLKKTDRINATYYKCLKLEDNVYCAVYDSIYKYSITTGKVEMMCQEVAYVDGVDCLDGYLYYESRGNGLTNNNCINRISLETGKVDMLIQDAGSFAFALKDNKIYYSKYKDFIYGGMRTKVYDIESGDAWYDDNVILYENSKNYHETNDSSYSVELAFDFNYNVKGFLNTPDGRILLCDNIGN